MTYLLKDYQHHIDVSVFSMYHFEIVSKFKL